MANKNYWLINLPIFTLLLISNGYFAYGQNRLGIFDLISKVPQYLEEPLAPPAPPIETVADPEIMYQCSEISNPKAYNIVEQIMNLALDALAEMNVQACSTTTPIKPMPEVIPEIIPEVMPDIIPEVVVQELRPDVKVDPEVSYFNPYYPMWPMMPPIPGMPQMPGMPQQMPNQYGQYWHSRARSSRRGQRLGRPFGPSRRSYGMKRQSLYGR